MRNAGRWVTLGLLVGAMGCGDDDAVSDPTCCGDVYPVWCRRFAECDLVAFSLSWTDAADCTAEQVPACQRGQDGDQLCASRTAPQTDACVSALDSASCDDLFGSAGLPRECR
jgi:hypothetical protein